MKGKTGIIVATAALGALAMFLFGLRGTAAEVVYPVENGRNWFARHVGTRLRGMFSRMDLAIENRRLKEENAALRMELTVRDSRAVPSAPGTSQQLPITNVIGSCETQYRIKAINSSGSSPSFTRPWSSPSLHTAVSPGYTLI